MRLSIDTVVFFLLLLLLIFFASFTFNGKTFSPICSQTKLRCPRNVTRFSIHIDQKENLSFVRSSIFATILSTIRQSTYYNNDSDSACLHLAPVDTLDRDRRSKRGHFLFFIEQRLKLFPQWSHPEKIHLIFNHYTGTWPRYDRQIDFHYPSNSILAITSLTADRYDCSRHVTFPLFHADYPSMTMVNTKSSRHILLSFKGKSYEDVQHHRTFFRHLHNDHDIIIEYTDQNNVSTDHEEYLRLLSHSHFCLVPSGRRLYSYRFLECLQYSCIPVITSEDDQSIVLPFSELIDWSSAVIFYQNRSLSLLPFYLRQIHENQRRSMRIQCKQIWLKYFSSISQIVVTLLDILHDRFFSFPS